MQVQRWRFDRQSEAQLAAYDARRLGVLVEEPVKVSFDARGGGPGGGKALRGPAHGEPPLLRGRRRVAVFPAGTWCYAERVFLPPELPPEVDAAGG